MIQTLNREAAIARMNTYAARQQPFLFIIDFELQAPIILRLEDVSPETLLYDIGGHTNCSIRDEIRQVPFFEKSPIAPIEYHRAFQYVQQEIRAGNSYLLNLAFPTPITTNYSLRNLFMISQAPYRLWLKEQFVVFSPEPFIRIQDNQIAAFPMKGTMDASLPNAHQLLLEDAKETAEHATIVDLIRNDLSMVASQVRVKRYRYIEEIKTHHGGLLQSSSEIVGQLEGRFLERLGDIIFQLLPAGSISGAPKRKTVEIIQAAEGRARGYYTGVCGIFDGNNVESAVMIRFIERGPGGLVFRSGGGITAQSNESEEYEELVRKAYLSFLATEKAVAP